MLGFSLGYGNNTAASAGAASGSLHEASPSPHPHLNNFTSVDTNRIKQAFDQWVKGTTPSAVYHPLPIGNIPPSPIT